MSISPLTGEANPATLSLVFPPWRQQTSPAIFGQRDVRLIKIFSIPKLARHLTMRLIQSFTVVRVSTASHFHAAPEFHFAKPSGMGEGLARHANNVCVTTSENRFSLVECRDAAGGHNRRREPRRVYGLFDLRHQRNRSAEWATLVGHCRRHAFIT